MKKNNAFLPICKNPIFAYTMTILAIEGPNAYGRVSRGPAIGQTLVPRTNFVNKLLDSVRRVKRVRVLPT